MKNKHNENAIELTIFKKPEKHSYEYEFNKVVSHYENQHNKWIANSFGWKKDTYPIYKRVLEHLLANEKMPIEDLENYFQLFIKRFCSQKPFSLLSMFHKEHTSDIVNWTVSTLKSFERYKTYQDSREIAQYFGLLIDNPKINLTRYYSSLVNKLIYHIEHSTNEQKDIDLEDSENSKPFNISSKDCFHNKLYNMDEFPVPLQKFKSTYAND